MKKTLIIFSALLLFCSAELYGADCVLLFTKARNVNDQWDNILPTRPPFIPTVKAIVRGELIDAYILFNGFQAKDGRFRVSGKIEMIKPDGTAKTIAEVPLTSRSAPPPKLADNAQLLNSISLEYTKGDPSGNYKFRLTLKDENSGVSYQSQTAEMTLADSVAPLLKSGKAMRDRTSELMIFHRTQDLSIIMPMLAEITTNILPEMRRNQKGFDPYSSLAIFYYAIKLNPVLTDDFIKLVSAQNGEPLTYLLYIAKALGEDVCSKLPESRRKLLPAKADAFDFKEVTEPFQNDILWSEFFITGKREPIQRIAGAVALANNGMSVDKFKKIKSPTKEDVEKLRSFLTGLSALWSLNANAGAQPLVYYYLEHMVVRGEIKDKFVLVAIAKILKDNAPEYSGAPAAKPQIKDLPATPASSGK